MELTMAVEHDFQSFFLEDDVDCRNTNFNEDKIMILSQDKMSSTNWPAPNVWVFISQRVKHCTRMQRSWVQILLKSQNYLQFLKLQLPIWRSDLHLKKVILSVETVSFIRVVYFFIDALLNIYNLRVTGHLPLKWIHLQSHISSKRQQGLKREHKSQVP